jgi:DNA-binding CsgD family transcriptional regulator
MRREDSQTRRAPGGVSVTAGDPCPPNHLERAREAGALYAWRDAYESYRLADAVSALTGADLDGLAQAAYLLGRESEFLELKERSHRAHLGANRVESAARDAFWLAMISLLRGEVAQASGWAARGERLIGDRDCAERGYLQMPVIEQMLRGGQHAAAHALAMKNVALGQRCGEGDLVAGARLQQGRAAIEMGQLAQGLRLLDEIMLAAVGDELSPIMTGLMYCAVVDTCRGAHEWTRAREWTAALSKWCDRQGGMVAFTDVCRVHRAEVLRMQGAWQHAMDEACRVCDRGEHADRPPPGTAYYEQGEVHRLRGEAREAEEAYRAASRRGYDPQPGLALLRLAQGRTDAAAAAMRRILGATTATNRGRILPAYAEIMLALGELDEAQRACEELELLCAERATEWLLAQAAHSRGTLCLRRGDACAALGHLRDSFERWERLGAPYESARVRACIAEACESLGDLESSALEREAARAVFEGLGARVELDRLASACERASPAGPLTAREREVLCLIAQGLTNKAIANKLGLSERTVDRHAANVFVKLDVNSRVAAAAYAFSHKLV